MQKRHEIIVRALNESNDDDGGASTALEIRCSCGEFLMDRVGTPAEASLPEITEIIRMHYAAQFMHDQHPERSNGTTKLIKGKK